jgi:hypothetical protein
MATKAVFATLLGIVEFYEDKSVDLCESLLYAIQQLSLVSTSCLNPSSFQ